MVNKMNWKKNRCLASSRSSRVGKIYVARIFDIKEPEQNQNRAVEPITFRRGGKEEVEG